MRSITRSWLAGLALCACAPSLAAQSNDVPTAQLEPLLGLEDVDVLEILAPDLDAVSLDDVRRADEGLPPRYAVPFPVDASPESMGTWEILPDGRRVWRLRVLAPGAESINLGFSAFDLPFGAELRLYATDFSSALRPFDEADEDAHGELWTPLVRTDDLMIELTMPAGAVGGVQLQLAQVGYGYRGFGSVGGGGGGQRSGACNVDVVCPEGDPWRNEIPSVAVISTGGSTFCTGFMVNNTSNDFRPFFITAQHCGIRSSNAASLVVYWNYETSVCDGTPDGRLDDFQTGSTFRAEYRPSDVTLVELDDDPDPAWEVSWAGWDARGDDAPGAIAIHHPSTDEKAISFEDDPTRTTSYLGNGSPGDGTHVRVDDWDLGTTEPGSSGSPLFDPDHRVIGQLHGGYAACGNDSADWYGKWSVSYDGGGSSSNSLEPWLDAAVTGSQFVDTIRAALFIDPATSVCHEGGIGGPFSNPSVVYTLTNLAQVPISYQVSLSQFIGLLLDGGTAPVGGTLPPGVSVQVTVSTGPGLDGLAAGVHTEFVQFDDLTNGVNSQRRHDVKVGQYLAYEFSLESNPGWTADGKWKWGVPTGDGGDEGFSDPTSGVTGAEVYGFNLVGDYPNNLSEKHLTSPPLDCSSLEQVEIRFWRWLNVDRPSRDKASFRVSSDGSNWTTVWENGEAVTENAWSQQSYDLTALAAGESTVYLRWTMGTTNGSDRYSGWNLDDIELWAFGRGSIATYGVGCPGTAGVTPTLNAVGVPSPDGTVTLTVEEGLPNGFGLLFGGFAPDLSGTSCFLVAPPFTVRLAWPLDANGARSLEALLPSNTPTDVHVYLQYLGVDPGAVGGLSASNGLDLYLR